MWSTELEVVPGGEHAATFSRDWFAFLPRRHPSSSEKKLYDLRMRGRRYRERNVGKMKIRRATKQAIKVGKIVPTPCKDCGSSDNIEIHHLNYTDPFAVEFLCEICHRKRHGAKRPNVRIKPWDESNRRTPRPTAPAAKGVALA